LEVKLYDKNIHREYKNKFKNAKLSFIANYNAIGKPYFAENTYDIVNNWQTFISFIEKNIKGNTNPLINGYIIYLKKVIYYLEAKTMNLKNTKSLVDFNTILDKIIKYYPNNLLESNNSKKSQGIDFYGKNIKYKKQRKIINFWIGFYFDVPKWDPYVCINCENLKENINGKNYYIDDDPKWLFLNDDLNKKLNNNNENIEEQERIIKDFIYEFINNL
jgi:hypothetical protein